MFPHRTPALERTKRNHPRACFRLLLACAPIVGAALPGCIAWEIRDEVRRSNQQIAAVTSVVNQTSNHVAQTDADLARASALLQELLAEVARTNAQLADMRAVLEHTQRLITQASDSIDLASPHLRNANDGLDLLRILEPINASLAGVHAQLAPLSKAMGSVGGALNFLGVGSSQELATDPAAPATPPPEGPAEAAPPAPQETAPAANPIVGAWVLVYPPVLGQPASIPATPGQPLPHAMILHADGRAVLDRQDRPVIAADWSREGRIVRFTFPPSGVPPTTPPPVQIEIISLTAKSLGVRAGDELHIYTRP